MDLFPPQQLEQALIDAGLVPNNCRLLEVVVPPAQLAIIRYEVFVDRDVLAKLATAFATAAAVDHTTKESA